MTVREIIRNLQDEQKKLRIENQRLNDELKAVTLEKKSIEKRLNSLENLLTDIKKKDSLVEDVKVEEETPQVVDVNVVLNKSIESINVEGTITEEGEFVLAGEEEPAPKPKRSNRKKKVEPEE